MITRYKACIVALLAVLWVAPAVAQMWPFAGPGQAGTPSSCQGPGDVASGAIVWYGLRAYSAATRGNIPVRPQPQLD
jgi:hypothetical protein